MTKNGPAFTFNIICKGMEHAIDVDLVPAFKFTGNSPPGFRDLHNPVVIQQQKSFEIF